MAVADAVKRLALSHPQTRFTFMTDLGSGFDWKASGDGEAGRAERLRQALGDDFAVNSLALDAAREGVRLAGRVGLPPSAGRTRSNNSCSSTAGRCATKSSGALRAA